MNNGDPGLSALALVWVEQSLLRVPPVAAWHHFAEVGSDGTAPWLRPPFSQLADETTPLEYEKEKRRRVFYLVTD